jgi:hypothetical protein
VFAGLLLATTVPAASADPSPPEVPFEPQRTVFVADPLILDPHGTAIESWSRHFDGLTLNFTSGVPDCFGVNVTATETAETVTVDLLGGTPPAAVGRMCIALAVQGTVEVPLQAPLGDRRVLTLDKAG